jgi:hypothetical protein
MITVVSGVPRSGTSLMMQMLAAGGMPLQTDEGRPADAHNPRGYFEDRRVKSLETDNTWVSEVEGRALKVVSLLLYQLPADLDYRVILMRRDLDEVLRSQQKMLGGGPTVGVSSELRQHFERHLAYVRQWLLDQPRMPLLEVDYRTLIERPRDVARSVTQFLKRDLDVEAMTSVVNPALYRQRGN